MVYLLFSGYICLKWIGPWSAVSGFLAAMFFLLMVSLAIIGIKSAHHSDLFYFKLIIKFFLTGGLSFLDFIMMPICWFVFILFYVNGLGDSLCPTFPRAFDAVGLCFNLNNATFLDLTFLLFFFNMDGSEY